MADWNKRRLGDICKVKGGKRLPKGISLVKQRNAHPYIRIRNLNTKVLDLDSMYEYIDDETQQSISKYIVATGDILISIVGTIGLVGIVGNSLHNANLTENCVKLTNLQNVDKEYLYYYLTSSLGQEEIKKGTVGAVQPKLPIKSIESIQILLPSNTIQKKIASILSSLDSKIETNRKIIDNLEQQAQALFKSWFIDFEPFKDGKFVDSEMGMIPKGWKVIYLGDLFNYQEGPGIRNWQHVANGTKFINIRCIYNGIINTETANMISNEEANRRYSHFLLRENDIVMSCSATLGRSAIVLKDKMIS